MATIQRGFRGKLEEYVDPTKDLTVEVTVSGQSTYDYCCFGVDAANKLSDDRYMIFYNQTSSPAGEIVFSQSAAGSQYQINLSRIPVNINKLVFTASIDGAGAMSAISRCVAKVTQPGRDALQFELVGSDFQNEKAIIVFEIYRKDVWRIVAVGSGFSGGLPELLKAYGGEEAAPAPAPLPTPVIPPPPTLQKITLEKGQKLSLSKNPNASLGEILVNLNWKQGRNAIDLDLGCLYELKSGGWFTSNKGCVQALGNSFGSFTSPPYIALDGDDRTGSNTEGENLRINGTKVSEIKRILVFTYIYGGAANWQEVDGVVTIKSPGQPEIIVRMDEYGSHLSHCAIAMLENKDDRTFTIEKLVRFFNGHEGMDRAYGWGMNWHTARK